MLEKLRLIFTIPELRNKVLFTLALLAVYRIGWQIPLPMIDQEAVSEFAKNMSGDLTKFLAKVSVFSGSQLNQATIFGLGIMPYISASIILQLMGTVYKPLEELKKEGEAGRKKINEYTRYLTVVLCLIQSAGYLWFVIMADPSGTGAQNMTNEAFEVANTGKLTLGWQLTAILIMTSGSVFLMWLGEQIDEYGIGNGISLLIMAGIVAMMPSALMSLLNNATFELNGFNSGIGLEKIIMLVMMFVGVVVGVVFVTLGQRRIPTQSAKHVRGRRVYGGTRQYMPLRVNQAGVMPIIFAQSLLMIPPFIFSYFGAGDGFFSGISLSLGGLLGDPTSMVYNLVYIGMIYFFCYFWTAITFNPKEISDNMKDNGTFIPGYRPGRRTEDYLEKVIERITYVGAGFLALIAVVPTIISELLGVDYMVASFYGGTGLLIAVSVAFDLVQKIDSHLVMRNHAGLLE
ncbi:preprotein translocase subunit SecY [Mariniblastus sp.]|nr:preprotein translocase subunit SecY [Mariniblastus sp.]MDA7903773.1 preprotein translocase subunit SecY [Mariniblastus sp.]